MFFLTRDLSADALANSKGYKGEVNRGNRKKCFALDNNKVFFALYNLFPFSGPSVLWEGPSVSCSLPPWLVWVLCACPVPLGRLSPSPPEHRCTGGGSRGGPQSGSVWAASRGRCGSCLCVAASWLTSCFVAVMTSSLPISSSCNGQRGLAGGGGGGDTWAANLEGALNLQTHKKSEGFFVVGGFGGFLMFFFDCF